MKRAPENTATRRRLGRPRHPSGVAHRNRVVTMVTDAELEKLATVANREGKSLSALVHQIVSQFLTGRE